MKNQGRISSGLDFFMRFRYTIVNEFPGGAWRILLSPFHTIKTAHVLVSQRAPFLLGEKHLT
jgi:hypothetical protein